MTEESPLVRQWILLRTLCSRRYGATVKEMAEEMGVSERTIRRDLDTFQQSGFPLAEIVEDHGRKKWRVEPGKNQPGLTFTLDEAISLYLRRQLITRGEVRHERAGLSTNTVHVHVCEDTCLGGAISRQPRHGSDRRISSCDAELHP